MNIRQLHLRPATPLRSRRARPFLDAVPLGAAGVWAHGVPAAFVIDPDPELSARQNLVMLLQAAAEIEHSLLVQYLYAAYSLKTQARSMRDDILDIATEEMGHLLTVQNVLRLLGGPLHFERQRFPYRSQLYPFPFKLQRLTKKSLAKYVYAEMPLTVAESVIPADRQADIAKLALEDADEVPLNHVGVLYGTIIERFGGVQDSELSPGAAPWQAVAGGSWDLTSNDLTPGLGVKVF